MYWCIVCGCGRVSHYTWLSLFPDQSITRWRNQRETFSALLAVCAGNSPHKGQRRGALIFSLMCAGINGWVNNRVAVDFRRHSALYDVIAMYLIVKLEGEYWPFRNVYDIFKIIALKIVNVVQKLCHFRYWYFVRHLYGAFEITYKNILLIYWTAYIFYICEDLWALRFNNLNNSSNISRLILIFLTCNTPCARTNKKCF